MTRWLTLAGLLLVAPPILAQEDADEILAKPEKVLPLWQLEPFDRVRLSDGAVHDIDPVRLPPGMDFSELEEGDYIGVPGLPPQPEIRRDVLFEIRLQNDGLDYRVEGRFIRDVEYYEDLVLEQFRTFVKKGEFDDAYHSLMAVHERDPEWPGVLVARWQFHAEEAARRVLAGDWERAFWTLIEERRLEKELQAREIEPPRRRSGANRPIDVRLGQVADRWIQRELSRDDPAGGRRVVARLEEFAPEHPTAARWRQEYATRVAPWLREARQALAKGNGLTASARIDSAVRWAPDLPDVRAGVDDLYRTHPVLKVATDRLPSYRHAMAGWSRSDWRVADLLHVPVSRLVGSLEDGQFESDVVASFEKSNVNKTLTIRMKKDLRWPGDDKSVTTVDLQRLLLDSTRSAGATYHPGLARLVVDLAPSLPWGLRVDFDRPQFAPAAWLQMPFVRIGRDRSLSSSLLGGSRIGWSGLGPYRLARRTDDRLTVLANPYFPREGLPNIEQIDEILYDSQAEQLRAIRDGRVHLMAYLAPRHVAKALEMPGVRVMTIIRPRVHLLQFDFDRPALQNRTLRRLIDFAIDREAVLRMCEVPQDDQHRAVTAPLPFGSFGYDESVRPRPHRMELARTLLLAVRKERRTVPALTLSHSGNETSRRAAREIIRQLEAVGLEIRLVEPEDRGSPNPLDADLRYQVITITDPVYDLVTLLTRDNPSLYEHASPWLRSLLVELMEVPNPTVARELLPQLHRALFDDVAILPLWQWQDRFLVSDEVAGLPLAPRSLYDGVAEWTAEPRYPPAYWKDASGMALRGGSE